MAAVSESGVQQKLQRALAAVAGLPARVLTAEGQEGLLREVARASREVLGGDLALVALFDPDRQGLTIRAAAGPTDHLGTRIPVAGTILGAVATTMRAEVVAEVLRDPRQGGRFLELSGIARGVFCPLKTGEISLGAIMVGQKKEAARSDGEDASDLTVLSLLAEQAANALQAGVTLDDERFLADKLARLGGYLARAESGWEPEGLSELLRQISHALGGEAAVLTGPVGDGALAVLDSWGLTPEEVASWNAGGFRSVALPAETFSGVVPAAGSHFPLWAYDLCARMPRSNGTNSRQTSQLHVLSRERQAPFRGVHLRLAEVVAVQVGGLLDRAGLLREIRSAADAERAASLRLRDLYDDISEGIVVIDGQVKVTFASRRACHVLRCSPNQLLGRNLLDAISSEDQLGLTNAVVKALGGSRVRGEIRLVVGTEARSLEFTARPADASAPGQAVRMVLRDVTEERRRESETLHREKLASVGQLAAGVAHEINNPVAFLISNMAWLEGRLSDLTFMIGCWRALAAMPEARPFLERLRTVEEAARIDDLLAELPHVIADSQEGLSRVKRIVADMRMFSRKDPEEAVEVDIPAAIDAALGMAAPMIRLKGKIDRDVSPILPIQGWPGRLSQVFLNLIVNAAHAIPEGDSARHRVGVKAWEDVEGVHVAISDTGCGISPENRMRLFTPFFTTKSPGEGTGLGLALAYETVRRHGGRILVDSQVGKGSTFTVFLPRNPGLLTPYRERTENTPSRGVMRLAV